MTEILRLLYEERLMGDYSVAFKGGTALSKCWKVIDRFSKDLDHVLLEFGGRNRGQPTETHTIESYLVDVPELQAITLPKATVQAYDPSYIMWEKLTALHQYSTMEREPDTHPLARHWYDVDCMLQKGVVDLASAHQARNDVVEMKKQRWAEKGVDYELALQGELKLIPDAERLAGLAADHKAAIQGRMFFIRRQPDDFDKIVERISRAQNVMNKAAIDALSNCSH